MSLSKVSGSSGSRPRSISSEPKRGLIGNIPGTCSLKRPRAVTSIARTVHANKLTSTWIGSSFGPLWMKQKHLDPARSPSICSGSRCFIHLLWTPSDILNRRIKEMQSFSLQTEPLSPEIRGRWTLSFNQMSISFSGPGDQKLVLTWKHARSCEHGASSASGSSRRSPRRRPT